MLAWPYGQAKVMSSYVWSGLDADSWVFGLITQYFFKVT
jgi:hypothetical protein